MLLSLMYLPNFLYMSEFWQVNLIVSFAILFVVYCSSSRNSLNLLRISGRLVTPYTNIGGGFAALGSAVLVIIFKIYVFSHFLI